MAQDNSWLVSLLALLPVLINGGNQGEELSEDQRIYNKVVIKYKAISLKPRRLVGQVPAKN